MNEHRVRVHETAYQPAPVTPVSAVKGGASTEATNTQASKHHAGAPCAADGP